MSTKTIGTLDDESLYVDCKSKGGGSLNDLPIELPTNSDEPNATFSGRKALTSSSRWKAVAFFSQAAGSGAVSGVSDVKKVSHAAESAMTDLRSPLSSSISASAASTIAQARGSIHEDAAPASGSPSTPMPALRK